VVPRALVRGEGGGARVVAVDTLARGEGVRVGMTLAEARAHVPSLASTVVDPSRIESLEATIVDALVVASPRLGRFEDDFFVEITTRDDLDRLDQIVRDLDLGPAAVGVADFAFAAHCAARVVEAKAGTPRRHVVPRGDDAGFLAPLSSSLLPASPTARDALSSLGLHTLGVVAALPLEGVQARFGEEGRFLVALARGAPMPTLATYVPKGEPVTEVDLVEASGDPTSDGATTLDAVLFALRSACLRLVPPLAAQGLGMGEVEVTLEHKKHRGQVGGATRLLVRPARPEIDPNALFELARATLEGAIHKGEIAPVTRLRLTATSLVPIEQTGERLAFARRDATVLPLDTALARLRGRFGTDRVVTPVRHEDPRPDGRGTFVVANSSTVLEQATTPPDAPIELRERLRTPSPAIGAVVLSRAPIPGDPWPVRAIGPTNPRAHKRTVAQVEPDERIVGGWWEEPYELVYRWVVADDGARALFARAAEHGGWRLVGLAD